jgi:hypothetical protein
MVRIHLPPGASPLFAAQLALTITALFAGERSTSTSPNSPRAFGLTIALSSPSGSWPTSGLHDAGEPRGRRRGPRGRRLLQHPRLALVARSRGPARKLALHNLRDHADQPASDEHAGRGRHDRNAPHDPVVGRSSCRAKCSWPRRDSNLPVGSAILGIDGKNVKPVGTVSLATQPTAAVAAPPPSLPVAVAITPDGKRALVVKSGANRVGLLDIDGQKVSYAQVDGKNYDTRDRGASRGADCGYRGTSLDRSIEVN